MIDSRGIPGWDKVDELANFLVSLTGLYVTNQKAEQIQHLYQQLSEFDKRPLTFKPRVRKPQHGRFARSKPYRKGHVSVEAVKR